MFIEIPLVLTEHSKSWFQREIKTKELGWRPALSSRAHCLCWGEVRGVSATSCYQVLVEKQVVERGLVGTEGSAALLFSCITAIFRLMLFGDIFRACVSHILERFQCGTWCVMICLFILHFCHDFRGREKKRAPHPTRNKKHPSPLNFRSVMRRQIANCLCHGQVPWP